MPAAKWGKSTKKMIVGNIWQCDRLITNLKKIELSYVSQKAAIWLKQFVRMILEWIVQREFILFLSIGLTG